MADFKSKYGAANQAFTITLNNLGAAGSRQSTAVDNTATLYQDALVSVTVVGGGTGAICYVYAFGTANDGTSYCGGAGASDAAITLQSPPNLTLIGTILVQASVPNYSKTMSVASAFGGTLPAKWGIVVTNRTASSFAANGNSATWQGVYGQVV